MRKKYHGQKPNEQRAERLLTYLREAAKRSTVLPSFDDLITACQAGSPEMLRLTLRYLHSTRAINTWMQGNRRHVLIDGVEMVQAPLRFARDNKATAKRGVPVITAPAKPERRRAEPKAVAGQARRYLALALSERLHATLSAIAAREGEKIETVAIEAMQRGLM